MSLFNNRLKSVIREGDVIDFAAKRKEHLRNKPLAQHADEIKQKRGGEEIAAQAELEGLQSSFKSIKESPNIPGFQSIDDILYWLVVEKMSAHQSESGIQRHFNPEERQRLTMVAHHAPRLIKRLQQSQDRIHAFMDKWTEVNQSVKSPFLESVIDMAAYMDTEIKGDMEVLSAIHKRFT